ncbi:MAG: pitrilysin family protein [Ferruginibacter sp.]
MKRIFIFFIGSFCLPIMILAQAKLVEKVTKKGEEIIIPYEKYVLPNGLTVIVSEDHSDPIVHVDVTYHVGSAREEIGKSGFAHFFEHMMFQGSDHVADDEHFKIVQSSGGTLNGSTNQDRTNYFETVPKNQLEKMLWLEADRMGFLLDAVTQKKFENQRETVKNERGQNYDNVPYGLLREVSAKNLYPYGHPYSWLTIGYIEDLNRSNVEDLKNFFLRWYGPNNATLTVGGDVNTKDVLAMAMKYFGPIKSGPVVKKATNLPVVLEKNRYVSYIDNYARTPRLSVVYPTVPQYHKDMAALSCLAQVMGQGGRGSRGGNSNSILYQALIKPQKALNASANSNLNELAGEFTFTITPYPGAGLDRMEKLLDSAFTTFEKRGITEDDIQKYKIINEVRIISSLASVQGKVAQLAAYQTYTGNPNKIKEQLAANNSLTAADVMRVYNQYIKNKNRLVISVLPKGKENLIASADNYTVNTSGYLKPSYGYDGLTYIKVNDNFDRSTVPESGPNPVISAPEFWEKTLENGIQIVGLEDKEIPMVNMNIYLKGGRLMESGDLSKAGLASLFAAMMNDDTQKHSAEDFSLALEKLGSTINVSSTKDAIVFSVQSLKKNLAPTLALLQERMLLPKFSNETFERLKKQAKENITNANTQASTVASNVYDYINYGPKNILGIADNGTVETLNHISLADIQNYYNSYIGFNDGRVVVVGDIKANDVVSQLNFLKKLPSKNFSLPEVADAVPLNKTVLYLVNIPKAAQTEFRIGYPTNLKYDATGDFYRAVLTNYNLGAAFSSRVNLNLREDKGWTYGARSNFAGDKYGGNFTFSSSIKANATDSALGEVMREIKQYATSGITEDEIKFMRQSIGQSDARNYETPAQKIAFINRIQQYQLPGDFVQQQSEILNHISKAEIDRFAKDYLNTDKINILLVGDREKILPGVEQMGYEIIELDTSGNPLKN